MAHPFQSVVYLQIRRGWIGLQVMTWSGNLGQWSGVPEALVFPDAKGKLRAYSVNDPRVANSSRYVPFVAFSHPRVLIDRVDETVLTLKLCLKRAKLSSTAVVKHQFVVHVLDELDGGVADVEMRTLVETCRRLGAASTRILSGTRELTAPEVLEISRRKFEPVREPVVLEV